MFFTINRLATLGPCAFTGCGKHTEWLEVPHGQLEIPGQQVEVENAYSKRKIQETVSISPDQKRVKVKLQLPEIGGRYSPYSFNGRYRLVTKEAVAGKSPQ